MSSGIADGVRTLTWADARAATLVLAPMLLMVWAVGNDGSWWVRGPLLAACSVWLLSAWGRRSVRSVLLMLHLLHSDRGGHR